MSITTLRPTNIINFKFINDNSFDWININGSKISLAEVKSLIAKKK